jgi:transposase
VFFDEFGFSYLEPLGPTWAPRGQRPVLRRVTRDRRAVSTTVGLTLSGKIYKRHFDGSIKSTGVIATLKHLQRYLSDGFILIWDRARVHTSKATQAYLVEHPEIIVELLPPYAPELNPEEYCHGNVKQQLKNARPAHKAQMRTLLDRGFARLRHRHDLLLSFFHHAGLSVKQLWLG